ncbi:MAG: hypothetical protein LLG13_00545, partial [Bacteroidales bacterium]|nr:hypothetical protein [Bacteroidales bacterium]
MKNLLTLLFLFITFNIQAQTTYFISPDGNDATGTGTSANPWKTLYKACGSVTTSGSIIHVNAG